MPMPRRAAIQAARSLLRQQPRRYASHEAHGAHAEAATESFGKGFYLTLAAIPASYFVYAASRGDTWFTDYLRSYESWNKTWEERNALHTTMVEQAGADRLLFLNSKGAEANRWVDLHFEEALNSGSPFNVPAGHYANVDKVVAHYRKQNEEEDQARIERTSKNRPIDPKLASVGYTSGV
ncbi:putative NADH-ubiquinone oxidoreductase 178 kDa subunit [Trichodelitschia bisporula]|uniref:Putative NADH-ubiquinone oxidoreductase 178 kDa subunit n=1 Tax=Trichodelitschia bisporula TaxID=703511 RepID=A0A6G1HWF6_9PEZI|nr:putative NADH-ubiquinone oxidoreductase 178 kDa subunit [Trichodelitschia bisporula]